MQDNPVRLGLTGGIGSGKSTVARILAKLGATIVDADAIARECTGADGLALPAISAIFGPGFVSSNGGMDRKKMRELVFVSVTAKAQLEGIIHPLVTANISRQVQIAKAAAARSIVLDIPLLIESARWRSEVDHILIVDCLESTQVDRVKARDGLSADTVSQILRSQVGRLQRLGAADAVLFNDGISVAELAQLVEEFGVHFGL